MKPQSERSAATDMMRFRVGRGENPNTEIGEWSRVPHHRVRGEYRWIALLSDSAGEVVDAPHEGAALVREGSVQQSIGYR